MSKYSERHGSGFVPASALPMPQQPDPISSRQVSDLASQLLDTYAGQQRSLLSEGEVLEPGRHSSTSTASEIAERRRTSRMYVIGLLAGYGMTVAGAEVALWLAIPKLSRIPGQWAMWPGFWALLTGLAFAFTLLRLHRDDKRHTPEGLALLREEHEHERALIIVGAEARRHDAGTRMLEQQAWRQAFENAQLEHQIADASEIKPQSHSNRLASYVPEPESVLAEQEAFRAKLLRYLCDPNSVDENGRFVGRVPWSARGAYSKPDSERCMRLFEHAERTNGFWIVRYDEDLRAWRLNVDRLSSSRHILAALEQVELTR